MENENPFGTFQPQPAPTFETTETKEETLGSHPPQEPSPKRKSRRSKRTPAAPLPASSGPKQAARRKYTRRTTTAVAPVRQPSTAVAAASTMKVVGELDIVMQIVDTLSHYDAKSKARILAAVAKFS